MFAGLASANGADGKGGDVEISGKEHLSFTGSAVASGQAGSGTVLFDPGTVTIVADTDGDTIPDFADVDLTGGVDADVDGIDDAFDVDGGTAADPTLAGVDPANLTDTFIDTVVTATLQSGVNGTNVTIATAGATAGAEDINITEGVRILWDQESTLQMEAGNDINALTDVFIQHSGDSDADTGGGVVLLAGNDINVGSALRDDANGNGVLGVAIGSEHGSNIFVAGDSNFDQTSDKAGSVVLTGGEDLNGVISGGRVLAAWLCHGYNAL